MEILAFGASNSKNSINRAFAYFVAGLFQNAPIVKWDISESTLPLYSIDLAKGFNQSSIYSRFKKTH